MFVFGPLRYLAKALILETTPRQLAWGFALGMVIGLVPKGNLIAVALMALFCSLRVNLAAGSGSIALFAWAGLFLDPISHHLGKYLLTRESLAGFWKAVADTKYTVWTDFNNTVVLGSLVIGLAALLPVYLASYPVFHRFAPPLANYIRRFRLVTLFFGGQLADRVV